MSNWIPFLQSLVWPVFLVVCLVCTRTEVKSILTCIKSRIERGDPLKIGTSGISLGESQRRIPLDALPTQSKDQKTTNVEEATDSNKKDVYFLADDETKAIDTAKPSDSPTQYKDTIYLSHKVTEWSVDSDGVPRCDIRVILVANRDDVLNKVERVVYHLHPTFPNPDREIRDREHNFELQTRAWGQFTISADIYFAGYKNPLTLHRYLNF